MKWPRPAYCFPVLPVFTGQTFTRAQIITALDCLGNEVRELKVCAFETANDMKLPYVVGHRRDGDLPAFWADATKAKKLLGWEATHTVEDMCRSAWDFAKKNTK